MKKGEPDICLTGCLFLGGAVKGKGVKGRQHTAQPAVFAQRKGEKLC